MSKVKNKYRFDEYEIGVIINALLCFRNQLIEEETYHDAVDELIMKLCK